jgi:VIT1/CCC1 family predicted Fe2+/Mn2+ transporter
MLVSTPRSALFFSIGFTLMALFIFGFVKGKFTTARPLRSALQTALIGAIAAGAAFLIATAIS